MELEVIHLVTKEIRTVCMTFIFKHVSWQLQKTQTDSVDDSKNFDVADLKLESAIPEKIRVNINLCE